MRMVALTHFDKLSAAPAPLPVGEGKVIDILAGCRRGLR